MDSPGSIRAIADKVEKILDKNSLPGPNPDALSAVVRAIAGLRTISGYAAEKAADIEYYAEVYYSVRKHDKFEGGSHAVFCQLKYDLLRAIRQYATMLQNQKTETN